MDLNEALANAPTELEGLFWTALMDRSFWSCYLEELMITDLDGPGDEPDDFPGEM